ASRWCSRPRSDPRRSARRPPVPATGAGRRSRRRRPPHRFLSSPDDRLYPLLERPVYLPAILRRVAAFDPDCVIEKLVAGAIDIDDLIVDDERADEPDRG